MRRNSITGRPSPGDHPGKHEFARHGLYRCQRLITTNTPSTAFSHHQRSAAARSCDHASRRTTIAAQSMTQHYRVRPVAEPIVTGAIVGVIASRRGQRSEPPRNNQSSPVDPRAMATGSVEAGRVGNCAGMPRRHRLRSSGQRGNQFGAITVSGCRRRGCGTAVNGPEGFRLPRRASGTTTVTAQGMNTRRKAK